MIRLSACMITLNEEHNLSRALESVRGVADEIVIVDCGSRERTSEIAREYGAKVITNAWTNFAQQKNSAAAAANNDWILSLDADEELSDELRGSLLAWKEGEPGCAVYEFARRAWYVGAWIKHSGWYPDRQRRLYRRDLARFSGIVHESKGADIPVNDPEISRHHCLLEVRDTYINLKDLDSTNGTFLDEERVRAAMLQDGTEFRIGGSVIRVNFQKK